MFETFFPASDYDLAATLASGQAFRWKAIDGAWEGVVNGRWVRLLQRPDGIQAFAFAPDWPALRHYLQVDLDLAAVIATFPKDEHLQRAVQCCKGLRLLRQDAWECLASFILSSTKQIVQIQQIVAAVCSCFGERIRGPGIMHAFPSAERIASLDETQLRSCKMGFRAPYLKGTAEMVAVGEVDLAALQCANVETARAELMRFPGVGRKIADCVLLFAYGFQQAFPVDVWILKALRQLYFPKRKPTPKKLLHFTETYFGPNAGYAQQYLFHYMRVHHPKNS